MFFPKGWFTPVLPPTEESTVAMTVVGTCMHPDATDVACCKTKHTPNKLLRVEQLRQKLQMAGTACPQCMVECCLALQKSSLLHPILCCAGHPVHMTNCLTTVCHLGHQHDTGVARGAFPVAHSELCLLLCLSCPDAKPGMQYSISSIQHAMSVLNGQHNCKDCLLEQHTQTVSVPATAPYLDEVDTPLVCGCSKPAHVTNDASAKSHKRGVAIQSALQCFVPDLLQHFQTLELLPIWKRDNLNFMSASRAEGVDAPTR